MAKRTVSFGDYTPPTYDEYTGEEPPAGQWFTGKVVRGTYMEEDDQVRFIVEIQDGDYAGWGKGWYAPFEGSLKWKMHEILRAMQGVEKDVTIDWANQAQLEAFIKKSREIKFLTEDYNDRISIKKVRPTLAGVPTTGKSAPAPSPQDLVEDDPAEEAVDDYTEEELTALSVEDLEKILVEEFEVPDDELPAKPRRDPSGAKYKAALVEEILAEQDGDEDGEAPADDDSDDPAEGDGDGEFDDGFVEDEPEPEPEPEPAPARRARKAAPAKATPAAAPATTRRRRS